MKVLVLGGDGYLGWPTALHLSARGYTVALLDNLSKRAWEGQCEVHPLIPILPLPERVTLWRRRTGRALDLFIGDITDYEFIAGVLRQWRPDAVVHYAEQASAPFSMIDAHHAAQTQVNNIVGTLNLLFALRDHAPRAHLVKLGTLGEYGTPNIDIEEGYIEIAHHGRRDVLPFPKQASSYYHLSKVHDSHNILFAARAWNLRATDLNQGVVYGLETEETKLAPGLVTSFHYDGIFGTVLNRFCVQAVLGIPLTVYGRGGQKRGFLNLRDTLQCVRLVMEHPPPAGQLRVLNQFTEIFSVRELAQTVQRAGRQLGMEVRIDHLDNPRIEKEDHYYRVSNTGLLELGLQPQFLSDELLNSMLLTIQRYARNVDLDRILPDVQWDPRVVPQPAQS